MGSSISAETAKNLIGAEQRGRQLLSHRPIQHIQAPTNHKHNNVICLNIDPDDPFQYYDIISPHKLTQLLNDLMLIKEKYRCNRTLMINTIVGLFPDWRSFANYLAPDLNLSNQHLLCDVIDVPRFFSYWQKERMKLITFIYGLHFTNLYVTEPLHPDGLPYYPDGLLPCHRGYFLRFCELRKLLDLLLPDTTLTNYEIFVIRLRLFNCNYAAM